MRWLSIVYVSTMHNVEYTGCDGDVWWENRLLVGLGGSVDIFTGPYIKHRRSQSLRPSFHWITFITPRSAARPDRFVSFRREIRFSISLRSWAARVLSVQNANCVFANISLPVSPRTNHPPHKPWVDHFALRKELKDRF